MAAAISSIEKPLAPPSPSPTMVKRGSNHPVHQTLACAANLANLLPTGTVFAFQTLTPIFSKDGCCQQLSNKFLTSSVIITCAVLCFSSSFTDSFIDNGGKRYYGISTFKGMYIFNYNNMEEDMNKYLEKYRIKFIDFVHAFISLMFFLIFALTNSNVQSCFFSGGGINTSELAMNLPLGAGVLSTLLFTIFPTTRRGIGYADMVPSLPTQSTINDI